MALTTIIPNTTPPFIKPQSVSHITNGITTDINGVSFPLQVGVPVQNIYTFKVIPSTGTTTSVLDAQKFAGDNTSGGTLQLNTVVKGTGTDIHSQPIVFLGQNGVLLDCERCLLVTLTEATTSTSVLTITGFDYRGVAIKWTSAELAIGTTTFSVNNPFSIVTSVSFAGNPFVGNINATISVGTSGFIGLPYYLKDVSYVISAMWNGATVESDDGAVFIGYNWRAVAALDTSYSARGVVNVGASLPNGSRLLVITYYVYGSDSELNAEINNLNQSSLKIVGVLNSGSAVPNPAPVFPYLVKQDLTGVQINPAGVSNPGGGGDQTFFEAYIAKTAV